METPRAPSVNDPVESAISVRVVRGIAEAVEQAGVSRSQFLRAAAIEPKTLASEDASIPRSEVDRLCELALDLTDDPALGLHWGERLNASTFNPISHIIAHSMTLRQSFESLFKFYRLLSDRESFQVVEQGDRATVQCLKSSSTSPRMQRLSAEMLAVGVLRLIRSFSPLASVGRFNFNYPAPTYGCEYTRVFAGAEHFSQPFTGVVFDRSLMEAVSPHKDADVHEALRRIAERRMVRLSRHVPFAVRVRDELVKHGSVHETGMDVIARSLGLSTRSLRRRLITEGKSYNELVNEALAFVAKQHLRDGQLTIQETAYEMGFADTSAFFRAFKRWTGMTPNAFRSALDDSLAANSQDVHSAHHDHVADVCEDTLENFTQGLDAARPAPEAPQRSTSVPRSFYHRSDRATP
jgi:AraC-like DNA-binding protein